MGNDMGFDPPVHPHPIGDLPTTDPHPGRITTTTRMGIDISTPTVKAVPKRFAITIGLDDRIYGPGNAIQSVFRFEDDSAEELWTRARQALVAILGGT